MHHEVCGFEGLHLHTDVGSHLDGLGKPEEYARRWRAHGDYLCISDHGMMSAIPTQIKVCERPEDDDQHKDKKLKPIFAIELYVNPLQRKFDSEKERKVFIDGLDAEQQRIFRKSFHLLAIAHNEIGYSNLVTLSSLAWIDGQYYRPRVNHQQLLEYKEGITFTSCCYASEIAQAFDRGGEDAGFAMIEKYMAMFGEHFYLEFMLLDFSKQRSYNAFIMKAHAKYKLPLIVTCDTHYAHPDDSKYQMYMLLMQTKKTVKELEQKIQDTGGEDLFAMQDPNLWMKTEDELNAKWESDYSQIIDYELFKQAKRNTVEICRKAGNVKLDRSLKLPELPFANEKLKEEVIKGFKFKDLPKTKEYQNRLKEELELIFNKNFSSYFLITKMTIDEAKRLSMLLFNTPNASGPGRGSCVGSLVCYCLGITEVDPIRHGLLFSRFLSSNRNDLPDIDLDFLVPVRDSLKNEWAPKQFGRDFVTNIGSYTTYGIKNGLIDVAKIFGKDRNEVLAITTKLGLKDEDGKVLTWDNAMKYYPELKKYCETNPEVADVAHKLLHRTKGMGKHAGGIIISSKAINKFVPLVKNKDGDIVSAWVEGLHGQELGPMGFIKYDWLVITNLEQRNYACKLIKERHNIAAICAKPGQEDWSDADAFISDSESLATASRGDLKGIFQFDSPGIISLVKRGGVTHFEDLVTYNSLYRPGPMESGMHDEYVERKHGRKPYEVHVLLQPILNNTKGVIAYQEQCMKIFNVVGNIPLENCYDLVKAISKKKEAEFAKWKVMFINNGQVNLAWAEEKVDELWKQLEAFAGYAFNQSHSTAYSYLAAQLLYLKTHYPLEFYAAVLHYETDADKIKEYKLDALRHDIKINALDLNKSKIKFDIIDNEIYFGFSNVKGIGEGIAEKIVKNQPYTGFSDFLHRCGADESILKPLIGLRIFKEANVEKLYTYYKWFRDVRDKRLARQKRFDASCAKHVKAANEEFGCNVASHKDILLLRNLDGVSEGLGELIAKHERCVNHYYEHAPTIDDVIPGLDKFILLPDDERPKIDEKLLALYKSPEECEKQFCGFLWHHPICKSPDYEGKRTFDILKEKDLKVGRVEVMINSVAKTTSKKGTSYWLMKIEDENGEEVFCQVWEDDWLRFKDDLRVGELVKIEVKTPDKGFNRYSLNGPLKWRREWDLPKTRAADFRVFVLRKPEISD